MTQADSHNRLAIVRREHDVMAWFARGLVVTQVAEKVGIPYQTVQRIRNRVIRRQQAELEADTKAVTVRQIGACQAIQREAWDAWENSKKPRVRAKKKRTPVLNDAGVPTSTMVETEESTVEAQVGNPAYLDRVIAAMKREAELTGADAPLKIAPTTPDGLRPWRPETDLDLRQRMLDLFTVLGTGQPVIDVQPVSATE